MKSFSVLGLTLGLAASAAATSSVTSSTLMPAWTTTAVGVSTVIPPYGSNTTTNATASTGSATSSITSSSTSTLTTSTSTSSVSASAANVLGLERTAMAFAAIVALGLSMA